MDLLSRLLMIDHQQRLTVDEALAHPYFAHLHGKPPVPMQPSNVAEEADDMVDVDEEEEGMSGKEEEDEEESLSSLDDSDSHTAVSENGSTSKAVGSVASLR